MDCNCNLNEIKITIVVILEYHLIHLLMDMNNTGVYSNNSKVYTNNSQIYYNHSVKFRIVPEPTLEFESRLDVFIQNLKNSFWSYEPSIKSIISSSNKIADYPFVSFSLIARWIFEQNYALHGKFYSRINHTIEYFHVDANTGIVKHIEMHNYFTDLTDPEEVLEDVKQRVKEYSKIWTTNCGTIQDLYHRIQNLELALYEERISRKVIFKTLLVSSLVICSMVICYCLGSKSNVDKQSA